MLFLLTVKAASYLEGVKYLQFIMIILEVLSRKDHDLHWKVKDPCDYSSCVRRVALDEAEEVGKEL